MCGIEINLALEDKVVSQKMEDEKYATSLISKFVTVQKRSSWTGSCVKDCAFLQMC